MTKISFSGKSVALLGGLAVLWACAPAQAAAPFAQSPQPSWQTNGRVRAIVYSGGAVYIGGEFTEVQPPGGGAPVARDHLAALDARTGDVLPWSPDADGNVWSLAVDPSGSTVYAGGEFTSIDGQARRYAAAIAAADGAVGSWDPEPDGFVYALQAVDSGDVLIGGAFTHVAGHTRNRLARVAADGTLSPWAPSIKQVAGFACPPRCPPLVAAITVSRDGSVVYVGGHFGLVNDVPRNNAAAVDATTGETLPWNPDVFGRGVGANGNQANKVWHIELGSGRVYVCGDFWMLNGFTRHPNVAAVDPVDGRLLSSFKATTDGNTPNCLFRDGVLYLGGHYLRVGPNAAWVFTVGQEATLTGPGSLSRTHIAAVDGATGAIDGWSPVANSTLGIHALAATPTQLLAGGDFTTIGHVDQQGYAQFPLDEAAPDTVLDGMPPDGWTKRWATFSFHSTERGSSYRCSLDGAPFAACASPMQYTGLGSGRHVVEIAAVDAAGNADCTPTAYAWSNAGAGPAPPTGLSATATSPSRVALSWDASPDPGVVGYRVYRDGAPLGQTAQNAYVDTAAPGAATVSYTVEAVDGTDDVSGEAAPAEVLTLPAPPPLFVDDFELGDLSQWTTVAGLAVDPSLVYAGSYAARATGAGAPAYGVRRLAAPVGELFYKARVKVISAATQATLLGVQTMWGGPVARVFVTPRGALGYQNQRKGPATTSTTAVVTPGWHDLELRVLVAGSASEVEIWLDGVRVSDLSQADDLGVTPLGRVQLGDAGNGRTYDVAFDDVAVGTSFVAG